MFRMAGQTAGPIETKLDTRTHVHPGSVSVKVNVKVIYVCGRRAITARVTRRGAAGAEQRAPKVRVARVELRPEDG